jgi:two-component system chemotaxis sensor kinase CheA
MNLEDALQTFVLESRELLDEMENALLALEQANDRSEMVNAIFRAVHTIKGSSGLFQLDHVVSFTHVVENLLDQLRAGELEITEAMTAILLSCCDHIRALVELIAAGENEPDVNLCQRGEPLLAMLQTLMAPPADARQDVGPCHMSDDVAVQPIDENRVHSDHWHISLRFGPDVLRNGMDPLSFIRYLQTLGRIVAIETIADGLPELALMNPENSYLGFESAFQSGASKTTIENVFEFVRDECKVLVLTPHSPVNDYVNLLREQIDPPRLSDMLLSCGTLTSQELEAALNAGDSAIDPIEITSVTQGSVQPAFVDGAQNQQKQVREMNTVESRSIRVDADKLDQLINLVGELIIAGASVNVIAQKAHVTELQESISRLSMLVEDVRDSALQLRMVKIGATFNRFQRVVHDVSRELGKEVQLSISGEDTELDKTVVEKIGDPLMHLVRNSLDHGIESAELRSQRGKPAQGVLFLNAFHDGGEVVITVEDDGGGLKKEKILAKAVERGLIGPDQHLSDADIYALIFEPAFSTADAVTKISGRGVGMDVVKRNIAALRGTVAIASQEGVGTRVTVRLPLTLAIIDGFLVGVDKAVYVIPLDMIEECIAYSAVPGHDYTNLRGEVLPFVRIRELFSIPGKPARGESIVVLKHAGQLAGLVVDSLMGEFQTVIKPLGKMFAQSKCISGSTILGSGDVALILDVPQLVRHAMSKNDKKLLESV